MTCEKLGDLLTNCRVDLLKRTRRTCMLQDGVDDLIDVLRIQAEPEGRNERKERNLGALELIARDLSHGHPLPSSFKASNSPPGDADP